MHSRQVPVWFSDGGPSGEWHDFSYLQPARSNRNIATSLFLMLWIAILDFCTPRTNFSVLYVAPLVLLAQSGAMKSGWRIAGLLVLLTYGIYILKNAINPSEGGHLFDYRLVNRTFVAVMIVVMSQVLRLWIRWREEQHDAEISEDFRRQDQEISATFAMLCCAPLIVLIALTDFLTPANFNWPILYSIPLFACGWTRSRPLLWSMLILLLVLAAAAFIWGAQPSTDAGVALQRNRMLAGLGMTIVTLMLHYWLGREKPGDR
ncbi:MAG: hypothetical protein HY288_00950 [Planctomycetia bacterium]|nr:hypothetical protein [Planctomycetia bacterium]